jgi:hypothetical protein
VKAFLAASKPTYPQFEAWIKAQPGVNLTKGNIHKLNVSIAGYVEIGAGASIWQSASIRNAGATASSRSRNRASAEPLAADAMNRSEVAGTASSDRWIRSLGMLLMRSLSGLPAGFCVARQGARSARCENLCTSARSHLINNVNRSISEGRHFAQSQGYGGSRRNRPIWHDDQACRNRQLRGRTAAPGQDGLIEKAGQLVS